MPSLDFDLESREFKHFFDANYQRFEDAKNSCIDIITALAKQSEIGELTKIEGRIKDKDECIKKFHRKYQGKLEADEQPYRIQDYISDLIGIRIVCLYEDQIVRVSELLRRHFRIIDVTDKIAAVESTEDSFGYKGLHIDMSMGENLIGEEQYRPFAGLCFEVQIRSLIQDAWSVLDHKIKYKNRFPTIFGGGSMSSRRCLSWLTGNLRKFVTPLPNCWKKPPLRLMRTKMPLRPHRMAVRR